MRAIDVDQARDEAQAKAIDSLARYKFMMFGYWAAIWVHLNRLHPSGTVQRNPFKAFVDLARNLREAQHGE